MPIFTADLDWPIPIYLTNDAAQYDQYNMNTPIKLKRISNLVRVSNTFDSESSGSNERDLSFDYNSVNK